MVLALKRKLNMTTMKSTVSSGKNKVTTMRGAGISQKNEIDLKEVVGNSPIAFYSTDSRGYLTFCNEAAIKLWGRAPELGKDLWCGSWKIYSPDGIPIPLEECPMAKTLNEGIPYENQQINIERPDGSIRTVLVFPRPILNEHGEITGAYNTLVDITDQQSARIKQETLSAIVKSSEDAVISKDLQGTITSWNAGAQKIFGYTEEEIIGKHISVLIPDSKLQDEDLILEKIKEGKRIHHFETIRRKKNGEEIPLSLTVSPVKDNQGRVIGASKVARDISERLRGEEKQAVLSAIVESSDDAIVSKNLNGIIMSWNKGAQQIFGYTEEEAVGKSVTILIPEERQSEEDVIIGKIRNGDKIDHFETIRRHKNGKEIIVSLTVSPIKDRKGKIIGASKIARDITAQVKAKEEIERHTRNLEILNSLGKSISRKMDVKAVLEQVTHATTQLSGASFGAFFYNEREGERDSYRLYSLSGLSKEAFENLKMPLNTDLLEHTFSQKDVVRIDDVTTDGHYGNFKEIKGMPKGSLPVTSYMAVPVISTSGGVTGAILLGHPEPGKFTKEHEDMVMGIAAQATIALDNSRLFEQVKALSDKKDEFIALASHELRTPLTTINGYLQVLAQKERDQMSKMFVEKSLYQVNKLNTLVEDLLNMARIEAGKMEFNIEEFDLRELLLDITETFGYSSKTHQLIHNLGESPVLIHGDKQRIEQAVNNLISNAVKYSPNANKVYLKLERNGGHVKVAVKDEGIGLTEEQQKKIFSRFYRAESTKGISGLGLGLYLTKQIIDRHQGELTLKSIFGKGSEFLFSLPLGKQNQ